MPSQQLWDVVGGGDKGGIVVRTGKDVSSPATDQRLSTGALVRQLALEDERLQYELLTGQGPQTGWVSVRLKDGKELVVRSQKPDPNGGSVPAATNGGAAPTDGGGAAEKLWRVVGGADKGGILVRTGMTPSSPAEAERLSTGATVRELGVSDGRLNYRRLSGSGPETGWVAIKLDGGKVLMEPVEASPSKPLPEELHGSARELLPAAPPPEGLPASLIRTLGAYDFNEVVDINANLPGEHFGELFPHTPEQLRESGAEWLTRAFHMAGTLPKDNEVKRVVSQREFIGGGAALKAILEVEYAKPDPNLHTSLFVKMPLNPDHKNRMVTLGLAQEGKEVFFSRFFTACLPFRTAKFYFADMCMKTCCWILITETIPFASDSTRGQRQPPGEVEAPVRKGLDFLELPDALDKYVALYRRAGMLTAWAESGRLGPQLAEFQPLNKANFLVGFPVSAKMLEQIWPNLEDFVLKHGKKLFPPEIANAAYMARFKAECIEMGPQLGKFNKYCLDGEDVWGYMHQNLHIDNAFFWRDEAGLQDCGLLDWGGVGPGLLLAQFVSGGGALSLANADLRIPYSDALVAVYYDTLAEFGGRRADVADMQVRVALMDMAYLLGSFKLIGKGVMGDVYDSLSKEEYEQLRGLDDPKFTEDSIPALMLRSAVTMLVEGMRTWRGRDYPRVFSSWRSKNGIK